MTSDIILCTVSNVDFSDWLIVELDNRGWSQSDLARAASVNPSSISHLVNRNRFPGNEICQAIARAFGYPPETVFRAAGLLPERAEIDKDTEELLYLYDRLAPESQAQVIDFTRFLAERKDNDTNGQAKK